MALLEAFYSEGSIYIVFKYIPISLAYLVVSLAYLTETQLAVILK